jgi:hypothetical protein
MREVSRAMGIGLVVMLPVSCAAFSEAEAPGEDGGQGDASEVDGAIDGSPDGGSRVDAGPRCNPSSPFGTPVPVTGGPANLGGSLKLTADEETAYYVDGAGTLYFAERLSDTALAPGVPVKVTSISGDDVPVVGPNLSDDLQTLYFDRDYRLWKATGEPGGPYRNAEAVGPADMQLAEAYYDEPHGALYASRYTGLTQLHREIMRAEVDQNGDPGAFVRLDLGSETSHNAVAAGDGASLFFASVRSDSLATDIYFALPGMPAERLEILNSSAIEIPTWLSRDRCHLYIATNRNATDGLRAYLAVRGR